MNSYKKNKVTKTVSTTTLPKYKWNPDTQQYEDKSTSVVTTYSYKKNKLVKTTSVYSDTQDKEVTTYKYSGKKLAKSVTVYTHVQRDKTENENYTRTTTAEYLQFNKKGDPAKMISTSIYRDKDEVTSGSTVYRYSYKYYKGNAIKSLTVSRDGINTTKYVFSKFKKVKTVAKSLSNSAKRTVGRSDALVSASSRSGLLKSAGSGSSYYYDDED